MASYVIDNNSRVFKPNSTHRQGWNGIAAFYHEIEYSFGGSQFKVKIIAETFEVARNMIVSKYGHIKGFNLDTQMTGSPETTGIHDVSEYMKKELIKVWSKEIDPLAERGV